MRSRGGMRAAVGMRTFLAELGCLPVSAMIHVPKAQEVFAPDGRFRDRLRINAGNPLSPRIRRAVATLGALAARQHAA